MPIEKVKGGYKVHNAHTVFKTRREALAQLQAIKASQARRGRRGKHGK